MMDPRSQELIQRYLNNELSTGELSALLEIFKDETIAREQFGQAIDQALKERTYAAHAPESRADSLFRDMLQAAREQEEKNVHRRQVPEWWQIMRGRLPWRSAIAAAVLLAVMITAIYYWQQRTAITPLVYAPHSTLTAPGNRSANKITLTLSGGASIVLDSADNGVLAQQGQTKVLKQQGFLSYAAGANKGTAPVYNTINVPRGRDYQVVLPDGSKVWLNAASSLRFPVAFTGHERRVELTGEAYFEVAANAVMPFLVTAKDMEIAVLGTAFNITAYSDENTVSSTLVSGMVKVNSGRGSVILTPGQQASLSTASPALEVQNVDITAITAWKNGYFQFNGADISTIVRQMARWYDVEPVFEGPVPEGHYRGKLLRDAPVEKFLEVLALNGITGRIDGRKIILTSATPINQKDH